MSNETGYNGWTNYPTWNVALWIDNDCGMSEYAQEMTQECHKAGTVDFRSPKAQLADRLKDWFDCMYDDRQLPNDGPFADMLQWALGQVSWLEVAEHYLPDIEEDAEAESL